MKKNIRPYELGMNRDTSASEAVLLNKAKKSVSRAQNEGEIVNASTLSLMQYLNARSILNAILVDDMNSSSTIVLKSALANIPRITIFPKLDLPKKELINIENQLNVSKNNIMLVTNSIMGIKTAKALSYVTCLFRYQSLNRAINYITQHIHIFIYNSFIFVCLSAMIQI
jgi:hypothetical protein